MHWLNSIFAGFPSCPCLQRLEFAFYLAKSENINTVSAFDFLDWKSLLEDRYPSLKVLEFEMMMEDEEAFDVAERKRVETIVRQSTRMANSKKFVMQWSEHVITTRLLIDQICLLKVGRDNHIFT